MAVSYNFAGPRIVKDGLVLYLDAGNPNSYNLSTPNTWKDISKRGNNGSLVNGTSVVSTSAGNVMSFDGVNDYISVSKQLSLVNASQFTLSAWMKRRLLNSKVICYQGANLNNDVAFELWNDNNAYFEVGNGSNSFGYVSNTSTQWQQLVMVFDGNQTGNSNRLKVYINGILQTLIFSGNIPATSGASDSVFSIGNTEGAGGNFSDGNIAQVQIYNRALSQSETTQNFNATRGRFGI